MGEAAARAVTPDGAAAQRPTTGSRAGLRTKRPIVLITHSYYEEDPRVRRQAEAILASGRPVDVISLRRPGDAATGDVAGVQVRRLDVQRHQGAGLGTYLSEYMAFFVRVTWTLIRSQPKRRYALVQVATLPDWLVLAAMPLRLVGVPVLIDLHESMPDFFRSRFPRAGNPFVHRGLVIAERLSIAASSHAITVNDALRDRLIRLGVAPDKVSVVRNTPSLARFDPSAHAPRTFMADGTLRLVYAGALTPTYELDVAVRALASVASRRPDLPVHLDVYGRGDSSDGLASLAEGLGITDQLTLHGRIPLEDVPAAVARADIGLAPTRRDDFTDSSLSTKILEYAAMRRPAIASRLPLVERTFPNGAVATYEPGNADDLADAILRAVDEPVARSKAVERAAEIVAQLSWERDAPPYLALLERFARGR
ncbi:MAG: glycosyltransferase family 4 protein [Chloroflexota bacterium]